MNEYTRYMWVAVLLAWAWAMAPIVWVMGNHDLGTALTWVGVVCALVLAWGMAWHYGTRYDGARTRMHGVPSHMERTHVDTYVMDDSGRIIASNGDYRIAMYKEEDNNK